MNLTALLADLRERREQATAGEWRIPADATDCIDTEDGMVAECYDPHSATTGNAPATAAHIAALHNAEPDLIAVLERHRDALRAARRELALATSLGAENIPAYDASIAALAAAEAVLAEWEGE